MSSLLLERAEELKSRIIESTWEWPGPPLNEDEFTGKATKVPPRWVQDAVSRVLTITGYAPIIYVGHNMARGEARNQFLGKVIAVTHHLIVTTEFSSEGTDTWTEPLSAFSVVHVATVDSVFEEKADWPTGLRFSAIASGEATTFPISSDATDVQKTEAKAVLRAMLAAVQG